MLLRTKWYATYSHHCSNHLISIQISSLSTVFLDPPSAATGLDPFHFNSDNSDGDAHIDEGAPFEELPAESQIAHDVAALLRKDKDNTIQELYRREREFFQGTVVSLPGKDKKRLLSNGL